MVGVPNPNFFMQLQLEQKPIYVNVNLNDYISKDPLVARQNTEAIKKMIAFHTDYHLKPVWDGTKRNLEEIEAYRVELDIPKNKTFIMPAGDNREQLIKMYPLVFNMCAEQGYNMTGRDHIIAFDRARGV